MSFKVKNLATFFQFWPTSLTIVARGHSFSMLQRIVKDIYIFCPVTPLRCIFTSKYVGSDHLIKLDFFFLHFKSFAFLGSALEMLQCC